MFKLVRSFYTFPLFIQWFIAILFSLSSIFLLVNTFFSLIFPINFLILPVFKSVGHFTVTPLLRLSGLLKYHSPLFITVKVSSEKWEIHNGTTFDYVLNMKWAYRGIQAKNLTIKSYLNGLLSLINELKKAENPNRIELVGTTYFVGDKTISRIGFIEERIQLWKKILFLIDYFNLSIMYSFSRGKIAFPNLFRLRKIKINGDELIKAENMIRLYNQFLNRADNSAVVNT